MSWAVAIWKEQINGQTEEHDGLVPAKWLDEKKMILWWPKGLHVLKRVNETPKKEWKKYQLVKVKLRSGQFKTIFLKITTHKILF